MKNQLLLLLLLLLLFFLAGCVPVDDLGAYWAKAGIDPELLGSWRVVGGELGNNGIVRKFTDIGGLYAVTVVNSSGERGDSNPECARTLAIGVYKFLVFACPQTNAAGKREAIIDRYKIDGNNLTSYGDLGPNWLEFVESHYPQAVNMKRNKGEGAYMTIALFDDEVAHILSTIPDTEKYWVREENLVRIR